MPYKSRAQAAYFNIHRKELEGQGVNVGEWNSASKGKKLPYHVVHGGAISNALRAARKYSEGGETFDAGGQATLHRYGRPNVQWDKDTQRQIQGDNRLRGIKPYVLPEDEMPLSGGEWARQAPKPMELADGGDAEGESWEPPPEPLEAGYPEQKPTARDIVSKIYRPPIVPLPGGQQSLTQYRPTARENLSQWLMGDKPSSLRKEMVGKLTGSEGAGTGIGALDFIPGVGTAFQAQEASQHGDPQALAMALMPGVHGPGGSLERQATKLLGEESSAIAKKYPTWIEKPGSKASDVERRAQSATEATKDILAEKNPELGETMSPSQAPPPKEEPVLPGPAPTPRGTLSDIYQQKFAGKTPEEIRAPSQETHASPIQEPNLAAVPEVARPFTEAGIKGVLGPAERKGFQRTQRPLVEPRGTPDELIYHRDMGSNYGYSQDDVSHYLAHEWASKNDSAYDPKVGNLNESHYTGAFKQLQQEKQKYGAPQPMVPHEASIFNLGKLSGDLDSQVAPIRQWAATQPTKVRDFVNDKLDEQLDRLPLVRQIQDDVKNAAQNIKEIEAGRKPIDFSIPTVQQSKKYIAAKVAEGNKLLNSMIGSVKPKIAAAYKEFTAKPAKDKAGWSGVETPKATEWTERLWKERKQEPPMKRGGSVDRAFRAAKPPLKRALGGPNISEVSMMQHGAMRNLHSEGMIKSGIPGRTDKLPMNVPAGSYVLPADIPSALGQGNSMAGGHILQKMFSSGPYGMAAPRGGGRGSSGRMMGMPRAASPNMPTVPSLMSGKKNSMGFAEGGKTTVPIIAAGGEFIVHPDVVKDIGHGSMNAGHRVLDQFVLHTRKQHIATLKGLKGPKK